MEWRSNERQQQQQQQRQQQQQQQQQQHMSWSKGVEGDEAQLVAGRQLSVCACDKAEQASQAGSSATNNTAQNDAPIRALG